MWTKISHKLTQIRRSIKVRVKEHLMCPQNPITIYVNHIKWENVDTMLSSIVEHRYFWSFLMYGGWSLPIVGSFATNVKAELVCINSLSNKSNVYYLTKQKRSGQLNKLNELYSVG